MAERSYRQICDLARSLNIVGDRWSMLIVRNLLLGPQRWSELIDALPGVARNLLSERLRQLERDGVLTHEGDHYQLTAAGAALERPLFALAEWAEQNAPRGPQEGYRFRLRYLMTSMRRTLPPTRREGWLQLIVDGAAYAVRLGREPTVVQGHHAAGLTVTCTSHSLLALRFQGASATALRESGALGVEGDASLLEAWVEAWRGSDAAQSS